ncbi:Uncharacterised protein [Candidatus Bilamarchaeum dharawalense]|uniref:Uncharacterized protein n=1 Tax=Candidatus Bilamarchaeum dharawalense TaxID=2885759 RepID=A0A5E4LSG6_9ARCH|nr:Uncharacterised protein [Candidatus Bilamarchaeum dharawalense]
MANIISVRGLVFLTLFTLLALAGMQITFSQLVGSSNQSLTFFQFLGPMAGGFLGMFGAVAVLGAQILNVILFTHKIDLLTVARFLPMMFGAYYFSRNTKRGFDDRLGIIIPLLAMAIFWMDPVGQQAWYYALFWTIPLLVKFLPDNLFLRSLGATFTAHAIGGAIWILAAIPMTPEAWTALLPVTATERLLFAAGIAVSYVFFTNVLSAVDKATDAGKYLNIEKKYVLLKN